MNPNIPQEVVQEKPARVIPILKDRRCAMLPKIQMHPSYKPWSRTVEKRPASISI